MKGWPALRRLGLVVGVLGGTLAVTAHVGSPDTIWEGNAGPYPIRVIIRDPGVIPGQAEIIVRSKGKVITAVRVTATVWNAEGSAPPPEVANRVPGDSTLWSSHLWFMASSSFGVQIIVDGPEGTGTAVVPFVAKATRVLLLAPSLGWLLALLAGMLVAGLITIVYAAVRESTLSPGMVSGESQKQRAFIGALITLAVAAWLLHAGNSWWGSEAAAYARGVLGSAPFATDASVVTSGNSATLTISIRDTAWRRVRTAGSGPQQRSRWTPLIPDHGKLMHAFLVSEQGDGMAHLHPLSTDSVTFITSLPPLPVGRYRLYADVVHESGWSQTLTTVVSIPAGLQQGSATDPDDAWTTRGPEAGTRVELGDGFQIEMVSDSGAMVAGRDLTLHFRVSAPNGQIAELEPYLGMAGHLVLVRDSTIYLHLHPTGTTSMAAAQQLAAHIGGAGAMSAHQMPEGQYSGELSFPYAFPSAGEYRIWVQVRTAAKVRTAAFRLPVGLPATKE